MPPGQAVTSFPSQSRAWDCSRRTSSSNRADAARSDADLSRKRIESMTEALLSKSTA